MPHLTIIKVGGAIVDNPTQLAILLREFAAIDGPKILVHGGGRRATMYATKLGIPTRIVNGRRVTDRDTLDVAIMVYGGLVNKNIVASVASLGVNAVGMTGADMGIVRARKRGMVRVDTPEGGETIDFGYVGDVVDVDHERLTWLLGEGITPIIAPITVDVGGQLLNTNADGLARAVAVACASSFDVSLIYVFEKEGVLLNEDDPHTLVRRMTNEEYQEYKSRGIIRGGMLPKMGNAIAAIEGGVKEVRITSYKNLFGGTIVEAG